MNAERNEKFIKTFYFLNKIVKERWIIKTMMWIFDEVGVSINIYVHEYYITLALWEEGRSLSS